MSDVLDRYVGEWSLPSNPKDSLKLNIPDSELAEAMAEAEKDIIESIKRLELGSTPLHAPISAETWHQRMD